MQILIRVSMTRLKYQTTPSRAFHIPLGSEYRLGRVVTCTRAAKTIAKCVEYTALPSVGIALSGLSIKKKIPQFLFYVFSNLLETHIAIT